MSEEISYEGLLYTTSTDAYNLHCVVENTCQNIERGVTHDSFT